MPSFSENIVATNNLQNKYLENNKWLAADEVTVVIYQKCDEEDSNHIKSYDKIKKKLSAPCKTWTCDLKFT